MKKQIQNTYIHIIILYFTVSSYVYVHCTSLSGVEQIRRRRHYTAKAQRRIIIIYRTNI